MGLCKANNCSTTSEYSHLNSLYMLALFNCHTFSELQSPRGPGFCHWEAKYLRGKKQV